MHLGAYFGIMPEIKVNILCKQIYNNLRGDVKKENIEEVNGCCSWITILNKVARWGLIGMSLNKTLIYLSEWCSRLRNRQYRYVPGTFEKTANNASVARVN